MAHSHGAGAGRGHDHSHAGSGHAGARHRRRLQLSLVLVGGFFLVELIGGLWSGSLSLLSDAGHMAADVIGLVAAVVATRVASGEPSGRRTYGSYRAEIFASGLAVLLMIGVAVFVVISAIARIGTEPEVHTTAMLVVGALGLAVNVVAMLVLHAGSKESLNVRGAYLEVFADTLGSVGVLVAGGLMILTGQSWWDSIVAVGIGVFVAIRAIGLGRHVLAVLGQQAPEGVEPGEVEAALGALEGVCEVHDLHLWTLTSGMHVATVHLVVMPGADDELLDRANAVLAEKYGIEHVTVQVEQSRRSECDRLDW